MSNKYDHGRCRHFNGVQNETCDKGVRYDQFFPGMPCIQWIEESVRGDTFLRAGEDPVRRVPRFRVQPPDRCQFYDEPTHEEVQQYRKQRDEDMARTEAAFEVAKNWRVTPKPDHDRHEVVVCPCCNGKIHLSQSAYNGHVHGICETKGCVSWME